MTKAACRCQSSHGQPSAAGTVAAIILFLASILPPPRVYRSTLRRPARTDNMLGLVSMKASLDSTGLAGLGILAGIKRLLGLTGPEAMAGDEARERCWWPGQADVAASEDSKMLGQCTSNQYQFPWCLMLRLQ